MGYLEKRVGFCSLKSGSQVNETDSIVCISNTKDVSDVECVLGISDNITNCSDNNIAALFIKSQLEKLYQQHEYVDYAGKIEAHKKYLAYIYKMSLMDINKRLFKKIADNNGVGSMGASFCGFLGYEMELYLAHVGNLQAFQIRAGKVKKLTTPHVIGSKVDKAAPPDIYDQEYRYLGFHPWVKIDFQTIKVESNDLYVVCSKDFYNYVDEKTMLLTMLNLEYNPQKCSEALVNLARQKGAKENIAVASIFYMNYMGLEMNKSEATRLKM